MDFVARFQFSQTFENKNSHNQQILLSKEYINVMQDFMFPYLTERKDFENKN